MSGIEINEEEEDSRRFSAYDYDYEISDCFSLIPDEIIVTIFNFLFLNEIRKCGMVCKRWRTISFVPTLWKEVVFGPQDKVKVTSLERILNCEVKNIYFVFSAVSDESLKPPYFKSLRFSKLEGLFLGNSTIKIKLYEELLSLTPNLKQLESPEYLNDKIFRRIANLKHLQDLQLVDAHITCVLKIIDIMKCSEKFLKLETLNLGGTYNGSPEMLSLFVGNLLELSPNAKHVNLSTFPVNDYVFKNLMGMQLLEQLHMPETIISLSREALGILKVRENFEKLETLDLHCAETETPDTFEMFIYNLLRLSPNLKDLVLSGLSLSERIFRRILTLKHINVLNLAQVSVNSLGIDAIGNYEKLSKLRVLFLHYANIPAELLVVLLSICPSLETLRITGASSDSVFEKIFRMRHVTRLSMSDINNDASFGRSCDLRNINGFVKLEFLRITYETFESNPVNLESFLPYCYNITELRLANIFLTNKIVRCIADLKNLHTLALMEMRSTYFSNINRFAIYPKIFTLEQIDITYDEFDGTTEELEVLLALCVNVKKLDMGNMFLTDGLLKTLLSLRKLENLSLSEISSSHLVDDYSNEENMTSLKRLEIYYNECEGSNGELGVFLPFCTNVERLSLHNITLTNRIYRCICTMNKLKTINICAEAIPQEKIIEILHNCPEITWHNFRELHGARHARH